jgi:hypothetical protein
MCKRIEPSAAQTKPPRLLAFISKFYEENPPSFGDDASDKKMLRDADLKFC